MQQGVVLTSRIPPLLTLRTHKPSLKPFQFLERTLINYPEIEFIAEADLAIHKDLYVNDHKLDGVTLCPAAFGLEAMSEAVLALLADRPLGLYRIFFLQFLLQWEWMRSQQSGSSLFAEPRTQQRSSLDLAIQNFRQIILRLSAASDIV